MAEAKRRSSRPPSTATSLWWSSCWSLEPPWRPGTALAAAPADQLSHQEMRSLGRTKRTEVRIYIIIIYYIYTCICSRIYMFFSSSFCFFLFWYCNCVLWCGMFVLFFGSFFWHVAFLFAGYVYHRKKHVPHAEKNTKHAHELQDCPPKALVDLWFWFVSFSLFVFACFELGPFILGLVYHNRKNHESHDKEKTTLLFAWKYPIDVEEYALCEAVPNRLNVVTLGSNHLQDTLFKTAETFTHFQTSSNLEPNHVKSMDVSLEARRRCSMLLRGAVSLWSSSSWNLALRWGRRVRTASASTARARGILGRSDGWCMLMFQCITLIIC